jgi:hypothetical protein
MRCAIRSASAALLSLCAFALADSSRAEDVVEPRSGARFAAKADGMSLLGVGLRTATFLRVKVYAVGFYVSDEALAGPLAVYRGRTDTPAFYRSLVNGDFAKQITEKFVRDVDRASIQEAMREALAGADPARVDAFVSYFTEVRAGQECVLRWGRGGVLETTMAGAARPPIADRAFATRVFAIWLGDEPIQDDIKRDLVARAPALLK